MKPDPAKLYGYGRIQICNTCVQPDHTGTWFPGRCLSLLLVQLVELLDQRAARRVRDRRHVVTVLLNKYSIYYIVSAARRVRDQLIQRHVVIQ